MSKDPGDIGFGLADKGVPAEEPLGALSRGDGAILLEGGMGGFYGRVDVVGGVGWAACPGYISTGVCLLALYRLTGDAVSEDIPTTSKRCPCFA